MTKTPIVRPISWINAAISVSILAAFVLVAWTFARTSGIFWGAIAYLALSQILRRTIPHHHRSAICHCKRQEFQQAITEFEKSIAFFSNNVWVDKYRAITMLSSSGMSYREMGMVSLGFCYAQLGDGMSARRIYEDCIRYYHNNGMAESALRMLDAGAGSPNAK